MPTARKYRFLRHRDSLRWIGAIFGLVMIRLYFSASYRAIASENARNDYINQVNSSPSEEYYTYYGVTSEKDVYSLWYIPQMYSDREILQSYPISGTDYLHCKLSGYNNYKVISSTTRENNSPIVSERSAKGREYESRLPQNPTGVYVPAECYIRSKLCMYIVDGAYPKCYTLESNIFYFM